MFLTRSFGGARSFPVSSGVILVFGFIIVVARISMWPSIATTGEGIRVYSLLGMYRTLPWNDVTEITVPSKDREIRVDLRSRHVVIKANEMGFMYHVVGKMYLGGGCGFLVVPDQENYDKLLADLKNYSPRFFLS
jgi:hypothetical protein